MMDESELINEVLELTLACQHGTATPEECARLERLLTDNPQAIRVYLRVVDDTLTLRDAATARDGAPASGLECLACTPMPADPSDRGRNSFFKFTKLRPRLMWATAIACAILVATASRISARRFVCKARSRFGEAN